MATREEVGRRVRVAREQMKLSQADLGRLLSRPRTHAAVSDIERGKTGLDVEELSELAMLLHKDLAYFYADEKPGIMYRRGERGQPEEELRQVDRSLDAFRQFAREQARRKREHQT